jgi:transketolase
MPDLRLVPQPELERLRGAAVDPDDRLALLADACRLNALVAVKRAGSGHLGSTFSALDIVTHLLFEELNVAQRGFDDPDRDVFFSSKGHDVPGLYAALFALGVVPRERLLRLRRLGGLDGHPDVGVPGIEASSGSLGMGISKGRGIALAKRRLGRTGRVVVMTGDGELQEGQNWEALQSAAHERLGRLWIVVDRNEVQSDKPTEEIVALGDLESKLRAFDWEVETVDGHDHAALRAAFVRFGEDDDTPKALVARTVKGKGVSFMEHPVALAEGGGTYRWHAGAPADEPFARAAAELETRLAERCAALGLEAPALEAVEPEAAVRGLEGEPESGAGSRPGPSVTDEYVVEAYGEALLELAATRDDLVVLDADLASDCRVRGFELAYPERFFQCGIAEQDMVSTAAGMARHGLLPVVNSFASFLASRANEQIYNQASEGSKVIYALHYAGLIPAGPGKSHQSIRDISLLAALPNVAIAQPGSAEEARALVRWAVEDAAESVAVRLAIGPSPRRLGLPAQASVGRGSVLHDGGDAVLVAYGPVMLHEALLAAERLGERGELSLRVVAMPWLNRFDDDWLATEVAGLEHVFVLEDHAPVGGLGDALRAALPGRRVTVFGVEGWPACGTPAEALHFHALDGESLAARIAAHAGRRAARAGSSAAR